jgi:hypothetical protein
MAQYRTPAGKSRRCRRRNARGAVELRRQVETNCDYAGRALPRKRKIHYGETDPHGIYGEASAEESRELAEGGIEVAASRISPPTPRP